MAGWFRPKVLAPVAVVTLLAVVAVLYFLGGPQRPVVSPEGIVPQATVAAEGGPLPFEGASGPPPEDGVEMPLIPIPGCRCHSDDLRVVEEHSRYRLSECAECH